MADFKSQDFLSGNVAATDVEILKKKELILVVKEQDTELPVVEVKAILLQALTEENMLKGTMRTRGSESELELQFRVKEIELEQKREQREETERQREH